MDNRYDSYDSSRGRVPRDLYREEPPRQRSSADRSAAQRPSGYAPQRSSARPAQTGYSRERAAERPREYSRDRVRAPQQASSRRSAGQTSSSAYGRPSTEGRTRSASQRSSVNRSRQAASSRENIDAQVSSYSRDAYAGRAQRPANQRSAAPSSRDSYARGNYAQGAPAAKKKRGLLPKVLIGLAVVLIAVGVGIGIYVNVVSGNLHKNVTQEALDALVETEYSKEPFFMLLLGTDESEERAEDSYYGGTFRADSIMLARIDCPNKKVTLVSLERDTLVDMGEYGVNKLNAATAIGGAALSIKCVSELAGVDISHYATINFDGFCSVVDALGGIEVDVPMEIDDWDAGGHLMPGLQTLNGEDALVLCRARAAYNDYGAGNSYRSANQRMVLSAIAQKVLKADLPTIASTVTTLSNFISTDLGMQDIIGIAQAMRGLDMTTDMYTAMQPTEGIYDGEMWYNVSIEPDWTNMMNRVKAGLPPTEGDVVDATGTVLATSGSGAKVGGYDMNTISNAKSGNVVIRNGGAPQGSGGLAAQSISSMGYTAEDIANASRNDYKNTLIVFNQPAQRNDALHIAQVLGVGQLVLNNGENTFTGDFLVILGADYNTSQANQNAQAQTAQGDQAASTNQ